VTYAAKTALVVLAAAAAMPLFARRKAPTPAVESARPAARVLRVPRAPAPLVLNGELTEPAWRSTPVARFLGPDGRDGRPYSEVRFLWSRDGFLHVGLYASDRNIVSAGVRNDGPVWRGDSFHLVFAKDGEERSFDVGPTARGPVLTDGARRTKGAWDYAWQSGAHAALDMDEGTVDDPSRADEEWVLELDVPLASIGLAPEPGQRVDFSARRCDVDVRGGPPLESPCPAVALTLVLDP
jgi:hypothetical protein